MNNNPRNIVLLIGAIIIGGVIGIMYPMLGILLA